LPRTFSVRTPSGGLHLYFAAPAQRLGNTAGKLGRGIDTRGAGGYVVGPGSVCNAGYYRIIDHSPIAELPKWVIQALAPTATAVSRATSLQQHHDRYLRAIPEGEAERVRTAAPGSRNNALNIAAFILGQLVGGAELSENEARAILRQAVRTHVGVDGFSTSEAEQTIASGLAAGAKQPRQV
jgi:Bifunctional DNA primase/polymerase, N-terminal